MLLIIQSKALCPLLTLTKDTYIYIYIYICFHSFRQGNAIAHVLVKSAKFSFLLLVWMEFVPLDINNFVVTDLSAS